MPTMNALSAAELTQMQADAQAALDQSCTIKRASRTPNSSGGASVTWNTVATVQAGMAEPTAGALQNYGYLVGSLAAWMIKLPVGANVQEQDQLVIGSQTLNVVKILAPRSYQVLLTLLAAEVK